MAIFVLVHGGWAGGWHWREVASLLRAAGHEVFTPTLTGLGERVHLATPDIGLDTHIQDILMVLEYEDLHAVILVGYSYSGMVITGVAERAPERLAQLVYLDAYVPRDGESLLDMLGPNAAAFIEQAALAYGDGWQIPHDPPDAPRRTPHPLKTGQQPVSLTNPAAAALPRTFIYCTQDKDAMGPVGLPITQAAERARSDGRWRYRELQTGHSPWETAPRELASLLLEVV
jgi:pimeloyl-ACP methyl ester carboxylesterase